MTHISELVGRARSLSHGYADCTPEQALVYACEDVALEHAPLRTLDRAATALLVEEICTEEDVDPPVVMFGRRRERCLALFEPVTRTVVFHGSAPSLADVIHEIAHITGPTGHHDVWFRTSLVRIARRWAGIEYASLLHNLFVGVGLETGAWSTGST